MQFDERDDKSEDMLIRRSSMMDDVDMPGALEGIMKPQINDS